MHLYFICYCFRDKLFKQSLSKLREEVCKANSLVREANFLAEEMGKDTEFSVTLQIPAQNLTPNRKVRTGVSKYFSPRAKSISPGAQQFFVALVR